MGDVKKRWRTSGRLPNRVSFRHSASAVINNRCFTRMGVGGYVDSILSERCKQCANVCFELWNGTLSFGLVRLWVWHRIYRTLPYRTLWYDMLLHIYSWQKKIQILKRKRDSWDSLRAVTDPNCPSDRIMKRSLAKGYIRSDKENPLSSPAKSPGEGAAKCNKTFAILQWWQLVWWLGWI